MEITAVQAGFDLDHIAIQSSNQKIMSEFYNKIMNMDLVLKENQDIICKGDSRKLILKKGKKNKLSFAGFSCRSLESLIAFKSSI